MFQQLVYPHKILEKSQSKIYPYGKTTLLELCRKVTLPVQRGCVTHNVEFQVIKGSGRPLIGQKMAIKLGILRKGIPEDISVMHSETESILTYLAVLE